MSHIVVGLSTKAGISTRKDCCKQKAFMELFMATEQGQSMFKAIKAVIAMQADCIKLIEDFGKGQTERFAIVLWYRCCT